MNKEHKYDFSYEIDEQFQVIECETCGFHHVYPYPDIEFISNFYSKQYKDEMSKINLKEKVERLDKILHKKEVLDIGCGSGELLLEFKGRGFDVYGLEPSKESSYECKKKGLHNVVNGFLNENAFGKKFELVNLSFVLEHVIDPFELIKNIKENFLSENGYLSIEVPNDFNLLQKIYSKFHEEQPYWIHFPDHISYWNMDSFKKFISSIGFDVIYQGSSFPLELFLLMDEDYIKDKSKGKIVHLKRVEFENKFKKTNQYDKLSEMYEKLSEINIGREIHIIAKNNKRYKLI